ncbi:MAG: hypothetical protein ACAH59_13270 [Pseudobdellovibrionaceae bacterium]
MQVLTAQKKIKRFKALWALLLLFLAIRVSAETTLAQNEEQQESQEDNRLSEIEQRFVNSNIAISEWFDGVAESLDLFLAGRKLTTRKNESNVMMESSVFLREGNQPDNSNSINADLRLPNVEEYWQVKFSTYDESKEKSALQKSELRKTARVRDPGATLGVFRRLGNVRTSFQPRIALTAPIKVSHSLAFESIADLVDYQVNPKLEFFANPDDGTGIFVAFNMNFILTKVFSLAVFNDSEYFERTHLNNVTNGLSLGQSLTKKTSFSYNLFFSSNNQPNYHLESYNLALTWHHLVYRNILRYNISPNIEFPEDQGFRAVPGIAVNLILQF